MRLIASPAALNPASAIGFSVTCPITVSDDAEINVTCPAFASSVPSILPATGSDRNWVTKTVSSESSPPPFEIAMPRGSGPTSVMVRMTWLDAVSMTDTLFDRALATYNFRPVGVKASPYGSVPTETLAATVP